ncbi:hypothetical protein NHX12_028040 [Muraenolepis orangiensis]|uniref:LINE-1 type transposase domain-containing 1 n=1 Tax=Muraenolepis orangiensis TaxID=630683 RepID=A0A9Q0IMG9_9TELE|nr:hypothetical protein NHX12_028040 [Muraenolepis orangiensis]
MSSSKLKKNSAQTPTITRASTSIAGKLSAWASTSNDGEDATGSLPATTETISMKQLVAEQAKQRAGLKEDVSHLIQESLKPLGSFQARLVATETIAGENFERLTTAEATIKALQAQNQTLMDHVDDIENRSRRSNLRIVNIPEGSENGKDPVKFIAELLVECVGPDVFTEPPELERAHRSLATKPKDGKPARPFVGSPLRFYPDLSSALARKRAEYNGVKQALYKKGVRFRLMHPARLVVTFEAQTFTFDSPEEAQEFYKRRVAKE